VRNLAEYAALRLLARHLGVIAIDRKRDYVGIKFAANALVDPPKLAQFVSEYKGAQFTPGGTLKFHLHGSSPEEILGQLREVMESLQAQQPA